MRWLVDAQLPPALARMLEAAGLPAEHVEDLGMRHASDSDIWDYSILQSCIVVTKDEDFANRASFAKSAPVIVWLRVGNCSRRALLNWFAPLLPDLIKRIESGEGLIEVR